MTESEAREILGDTIQPDNTLYNLGHYIAWPAFKNLVTLDCQFDVAELKAIAWWMENITPTPKEPKDETPR